MGRPRFWEFVRCLECLWPLSVKATLWEQERNDSNQPEAIGQEKGLTGSF